MTKENDWQKEMGEIFGLAFLLERKLEYTFDKVLAPHNLTIKQWLVLVVIEKMHAEKPSIQEVARQLNTSHQNIKAIALNLEKRGFVTLETDPRDKRVTRLATTPQCKEFWHKRASKHKVLIAELFTHLTSHETVILHQLLDKLIQGVDELSENINIETKEKADEDGYVNS